MPEPRDKQRVEKWRKARKSTRGKQRKTNARREIGNPERKKQMEDKVTEELSEDAKNDRRG